MFLTRKSKCIVRNDNNERYPGEKRDIIFKRLNNLSYILVYTIALLIVNFCIAVFGENAKLGETITAIRPILLVVEYVLMFILIFQKELQLYSESDFILSAKQYIRKQMIISSDLWLIYLLIVLILGRIALYGSFLFGSILFWGLVVVTNFTLRKV